MQELDLAKLREDAAYNFRKAEEISKETNEDGLLSDDQRTEITRLQAEGNEYLDRVKAVEETQAVQRQATDAYGELLKPVERKLPQSQPGDGYPAKTIEIPRTHPRRYASFQGKDAERNAHVSGLWLRANVFGDPMSRMQNHEKVAEAQRHIRDYFPEVRALGTTTAAGGGALVPQELAAAVIERREQFGTYERLTNRQTINDQALFPRITSDQTATFSAENVAIGENNLTLDNVSLNPKPLTTLSKMSNQLINASAVDLAEVVARDFGRRFAKRIDTAGFNGGLVIADDDDNGGIRGAVKVIQETTGLAGNIVAAGNTLSAVTQANITELLGVFPVYAHQANPFWICSNVVKEGVFGRLQMASGGVTKLETTLGTFDSYQGIPIITTPLMRSITTAMTTGDVFILLADLQLGSYMGVSEELAIETSVERYFELAQTAIRGVMRVDIVNYDIGTTTTGDTGSIVGLRST